MKLISKFQWKKVLIWSIPLLLVLAYLGFRVRHASPSGSEPTLQDILEEIATDGQESYVTKRVIRHLPELRGYLPQLTRRLSSSEMEVRAALAEITGLLTEGLSSNDRKRADFAHSFGHLSVYVEFAACQPSDRRMFLELLDAAHGAMTRWPGLTSSAAIAMPRFSADAREKPTSEYCRGKMPSNTPQRHPTISFGPITATEKESQAWGWEKATHDQCHGRNAPRFALHENLLGCITKGNEMTYETQSRASVRGMPLPALKHSGVARYESHDSEAWGVWRASQTVTNKLRS